MMLKNVTHTRAKQMLSPYIIATQVARASEQEQRCFDEHHEVSKAEKAIVEMQRRFWMYARELARDACLGVVTMTKYLVQARKRELVENKQMVISSSRLHLWRRKT
jgi:hypothetical protein